MTRSLHLEYPCTLPDALQKTPTEFEREAKMAMAVKLLSWAAFPPAKPPNWSGLSVRHFSYACPISAPA